MPIKHIGFQNLLYRKFVSPGEHDAKKIAAAIGESLSTFYNYCEGISYCPVDLVARLYNATGDAEFLTFIVNETPLMLTPRQAPAGGKDVTAETLDALAAAGRLASEVQQAVSDGNMSDRDANQVLKRIDETMKELEDLRKAVVMRKR